MSPIRFVIAGAGLIAPAYLEAIAALPECELVGVISRKECLPESFAAHLPPLEHAHSLAELRTPWDALIVTLPNGLHHPIAIEAATLGKHVLVEKVLDINLPACDEMIASCRANGVKLGVSYQRRLEPVNRRVKSWLERGLLGRVIAVEVDARTYRPPAYYAQAAYRGGAAIDGGGPLIQQAAHDVDLLCWFFGLPQWLAGVSDNFLHTIECEDYAAALMRYESGMIASLSAATCCPPGCASGITFFTDRGRLVLRGDAIVSCDIADLPLEEPLSALPLGHTGIVADFVNAIRTGQEPLINGESARLSVELIRRIYAAAEIHRTTGHTTS